MSVLVLFDACVWELVANVCDARFALRSDWSSDKDKKAMDDAEKQGIAWFEKHLS